MFKSHRGSMLATLIVLALLTVASCGSQEGSQGDQSGDKDKAGADGSTGSAQSATTAETTEGGEQKGGGQKDVEQKGGGQKDGATGAMKVRDGTFWVDKAGTVEFQVNNNALDLRDVSPKSGWRQQIAAQSSDDIEVHFLKGNVDWKFEVEIDNNMEISEEQDISQAQGGTYKVGDAGEVRFRSDGGSLTLVNVQTNTGWKATKRDVSSDDIEIDFRQGRTKAEFGAELDDSGRLSLEINQKLKGPIPS